MNRAVLPELLRIKLTDIAEENLWLDDQESKEALDYLFNIRKLDEKTIRKFRFGYVARRAINRIPVLGEKFAGKIIMPLFDPYNNLVILTSRDFRTEDKKRKHWHESFDKSWYLYGLNCAKHNIIHSNSVIVVEGQFDTSKMHKFGFHNTVGILGSAFDIRHACLLSSRCRKIFLLFDNDNSGRDNIKKSIEMYRNNGWESVGIELIPVNLTDVKDPDDFLDKHGKDSMSKLINNSYRKFKENKKWLESLSPTKLSI